uniref:Exostosin GT47 domain-containing protein n=1 Tax=Physcomitrium patens TaxID=3218 RepID=A0A2K1KDS5_PHYPA|nr:hypothetical protein PHYPA_008308 [Physcomitrium patens]
MARPRRCLGERAHPTFLTSVVIAVSAIVLLQHICTTKGPAYSLLHSSLISRQAEPVLSKLDALTPTKGRHQKNLTPSSPEMISETENVSTQAQSLSSNKRQDFSENFLHAGNESQMFTAVESEVSETGKEFNNNGTDLLVPETSNRQVSSEILNNGTMVESVVAEAATERQVVAVETEAVQIVKGVINSINSSENMAEVADRMDLDHNRSELTVPNAESDSKGAIPVGGDEAVDVMQPRRFESLGDANVGRIPVETETSHEENKQQLMIASWPPQASPVPKTCKKAIEGATLETADPSLDSSLYKNVTAFSKSYELMEKVFKVYIYKDGRKPLVHSGPQLGIYASEGQFIERMEAASEFLTDDPSRAHMFFLPYSVYRMVTHLYVPNSRSMLPLATFIKDYVEALARQYPYWNRTKGADHFFVSCHDWGPATARDHPTLRSNAVKVVCNADLTEEFVVGKDASLPEVYMHKSKTKAPIKLGGPGYDERPYLAFFAGQMHGRVRPILLDHWKDKDPDLMIYGVLPKPIAKQISYVQHMKMSKYCICAAGYEVNSPRIVESIHYDCVPVIIADNFVLPFSDVLNWDAFSVTMPESDIPKLKAILNDIPEKTYRSMQIRLRKIRQHFVWHKKPEKYDVFHMILHSVWMSRINRLEQIRDLSEEPFKD